MSDRAQRRSSSDKIIASAELASVRVQLREQGQTVVQCHGCFDIVHPGHIRYLQFARGLGDVLVVSVSADEVVGKGTGRPYINEQLRMENLAAFEFVDYVCLDHNTWGGPILDLIRPDIYVKGKEYETKGDPRFAKEVELVEGYGGKVMFSSGDVIYSSTYILDHFRDRFPVESERLAAYCRRHHIDRTAIGAILRQTVGRKILVLGDPIIDRYIHCESLGVASEQPMLSVTPMHESTYLGAGALIAGQLAELGVTAGLLTALPKGAEAERFREAARDGNIAVHAVIDEDRPLAVKTRYLVDEQKVFKVDQGRRLPVIGPVARALIAQLAEQLAHYDALIVTDFGYGLFNAAVITAIGDLCREHDRPYYLDVSHTRRASILQFRGPRLATPTEHELRFAFSDNEAGLSNLAARFLRETDAEYLALTMGKRGAMLFERPTEVKQPHLV
ncbi:MAG: PfkB family carbohydrate kinase, partial [Myxococcota bacterium]